MRSSKAHSPASKFGVFNRILLVSLFSVHVLAQPALLPFQDCTSGDALSPSQRINVSQVYGQIVTDDTLGKHLNLTVFGVTGSPIIPISNDTGLLSTLFTTSSVLSFSVWDNSSFFCSTLRPPSPLTPLEANSTNFYCPLSPGPLAFSAYVPFNNHTFELYTISTRLRVVDTSAPAVEIACIDIEATPLVSGAVHSIYGHAAIIFWVTVSLAIAYWVVVGLGRVVAAWGRGGAIGHRLWSRLENAGFILASAISGERLAVTPALMRFGTPSMRDIVFHTQWCTAVGMMALQWPTFSYVFFAQTAWSTLTYNITLTQGTNASEEHWNPLNTQPFTPPSGFADQVSDPSSPIFIEANATNTLMSLPLNARPGMEMFASTVGLRPQDLFGICLALFFIIVAGTIVISITIWGLDSLLSSMFGRGHREDNFRSRSPPYNPAPKDSTDKPATSTGEEDQPSSAGHHLFRSMSHPLANSFGRSWWRLGHRVRPNSFHGSVLHGNLVRILILFHFPVTIFSCYQFTIGRGHATMGSIVLAVFSFAILSVAIPLWLILRLTRTATSKLYDETRTLLMLGPLYNHYGHGSQLFACLLFTSNLVFGITIGCGQKSGTAQAIIVLIGEVASALGTSIWLPWGQGAGMGLISFFFCVARITIAVLLVILTPIVSVGNAAGGWVAAAILFILGLIYLVFLLILIVKILEGLLRIGWRIPFDRSRHSIDSGVFGVLGLIGCCRPRRGRKSRKHYHSPEQNGTFAFTPQFNGPKGSTPRSSTMGTPSVLRPEQASRPYREESDDETGYIMGAWQPFPIPRKEYSPVRDAPQTPSTESHPATSGFSRVAGGRAHFKSPYAITENSANSTQRFPSMERTHSQGTLPASQSTRNIASGNTSTSTINNAGSSSLPAGAMAPTRPAAHVRTKSQTAIIEDASVLYRQQQQQQPLAGPSNPTDRRSDPLTPPQIVIDDDDSSSGAQPRKKHWYNIRRSRRMSEGNLPSAEVEQPPQEETGRSFVVLRDKRPSPLARSERANPDETSAQLRLVDRQSFQVARDTPGTPRRTSAEDPRPNRPPMSSRQSTRRMSYTA
ncbi:hypothetical protein BD410DRAFT_710678 [Rickenella mellea]|uniref:TRP C-terminal domain-containing protein n=1 Tax=Rickenella mellea TaxID=50990 RepID=A0A4V3AZJ7_9AGAM|nr:hypothetical protein BD410DRAFT_710678 [Rickenella mellea]